MQPEIPFLKTGVSTRAPCFVDHGDGCFFSEKMVLEKFASLRCHGTDLMEMLQVPYSFEWNYPVISNYQDAIVILRMSEEGKKTKGAEYIPEDELMNRLHPDLIERFLKDLGEDEEPYWELHSQIEVLVDWLEIRLEKGLAILKE